jgi:Spx/MgsR family transcriptional regulator
MTITVYGIPNCQTVKKARDWLETHQVNFTFHDFKKQGVTKAMLLKWLEQVDFNQLINRSGMTYRNLSDQQKLQSQQQDGAIVLMLQNPSMIKRPVLELPQSIHLGFKEGDYGTLFGKSA